MESNEIALAAIAAVGLIGCGWALGLTRALQVSEAANANLRAQVAHLTNAPPPPPREARANGKLFALPLFGEKEDAA